MFSRYGIWEASHKVRIKFTGILPGGLCDDKLFGHRESSRS